MGKNFGYLSREVVGQCFKFCVKCEVMTNETLEQFSRKCILFVAKLRLYFDELSFGYIFRNS